MDGMDRTARAFLELLFRSAVAAAHPAAVLPAHLPEPPARGRLVILAAGKAAGSMTEVAEQHYLGAAAAATARRPRGHPPRLWAADATCSAHRSRPPGPGRRRHLYSRTGARARRCGRCRAIWCWCSFPAAPRPTGSRRRGLTLAEKQAVTRALLKRRRRDRRDQHRAQASLAHQGRPARRARLSRPRRRRSRSPTCRATTRR